MGSLAVISIFVTKPSPLQAVTIWYGIDSDKHGHWVSDTEGVSTLEGDFMHIIRYLFQGFKIFSITET